MNDRKETRRGGDKRSSWQTFHRRLFLVRTLTKGAATAEQLISLTQSYFDDEIYPADARSALRHDLAALREQFECVIAVTSDGKYQIIDYGRLALLDLSNRDLEALSYLFNTVVDNPLPGAVLSDAILSRIVNMLPSETRTTLAKFRNPVFVDLPRPSTSVSVDFFLRLKDVVGRNMISFVYQSPETLENVLGVKVVVAPRYMFIRESHVYLEGYCHESDSNNYQGRYITCRIDRIVEDSLRVLPTILSPRPEVKPSYAIRYWLSPRVAANRDVDLLFPESTLAFMADGSATVTARVTDLQHAQEMLLRYKEHCKVIEPLELVQMMKQSIAAMTNLYSDIEG